MNTTGYKDYGFKSAAESHMHRHFLPQVFRFAGHLEAGTRVLDVGCGNGFTCGESLRRGCRVVGIDPSEQGFALACQNYSAGRFEILGADQDILRNLAEEPFDLVVSTEVVEHLYSPCEWAARCYAALRPGGKLLCTTPYHGYFKNLLISLSGGWDKHADPLWDGGHIKLWSRRTLSTLLTEASFKNLQFAGAGRLPGLWMTTVMSAERPLAGAYV